MVQVSTSLLNTKEGKEIDTILNLEKAGTDYFHIDVMDGNFVEKNNYQKMLDISSYIKRLSNLPIDLHLMVENVKEAINDFMDYEPNIITFHLEACRNEEEVLESRVYTLPEEEKEFEIKHPTAHSWEIVGDKIIKFYRMTNISTDDGMMKLLTKLRKLRIDDKLEELGAEDGDTVILDDFAFEYYR